MKARKREKEREREREMEKSDSVCSSCNESRRGCKPREMHYAFGQFLLPSLASTTVCTLALKKRERKKGQRGRERKRERDGGKEKKNRKKRRILSFSLSRSWLVVGARRFIEQRINNKPACSPYLLVPSLLFSSLYLRLTVLPRSILRLDE